MRQPPHSSTHPSQNVWGDLHTTWRSPHVEIILQRNANCALNHKNEMEIILNGRRVDVVFLCETHLTPRHRFFSQELPTRSSRRTYPRVFSNSHTFQYSSSLCPLINIPFYRLLQFLYIVLLFHSFLLLYTVHPEFM